LFKKVTRGAAKALQTVIPRPGGKLGGVAARGEIVEVLQKPHEFQDSSALWRAVTVSVRRVDQPIGPTTVTVYLHGDGWRMICEGDNVPIRVDESTGAILGIDGDAYEAEVERQVEELQSQPPPDVRSIDADAIAPIDGVTFEHWVAVEAGIARDRVAPGDLESYAETHGVPAGQWTTTRRAWQQRMTSDWRIGARFGEAFQAEMQRPSR
jgi:hypothetical protein